MPKIFNDTTAIKKPVRPKQASPGFGALASKPAAPDATILAPGPAAPKTKPKRKARATAKPTRAGRPLKPAKEKESKQVGLLLTPREYEHLRTRAGLVPVATYLKHFLRNETDQLSKPK